MKGQGEKGREIPSQTGIAGAERIDLAAFL
jgi:hypothetical protein